MWRLFEYGAQVTDIQPYIFLLFVLNSYLLIFLKFDMYLNIVTVRLWSDLYCARQLEMRRLLLGGALS